MRTPTNEQETVIRWYKDEQNATVYTSDYSMMVRYDKNLSSGDWVLIKEETCDGDIVSKTYSVPKNLVYGRGKKRKEMSDAEKEKRSLFMKSLHAKDNS